MCSVTRLTADVTSSFLWVRSRHAVLWDENASFTHMHLYQNWVKMSLKLFVSCLLEKIVLQFHVLIRAFLKRFCVLLITVKLDYYLHRLIKQSSACVVQSQHQSSLVDGKSSLLMVVSTFYSSTGADHGSINRGYRINHRSCMDRRYSPW